jgi:hypothetical protein
MPLGARPKLGPAGPGSGDLLTLPYPHTHQSVDLFIGEKLACFALENTFLIRKREDCDHRLDWGVNACILKRTSLLGQ